MTLPFDHNTYLECVSPVLYIILCYLHNYITAKMPRSAEGDVLTDRWADILEVLEKNLIPFARKACSADYKFVPKSKVHNIYTHSKHALGDYAKVAEIMSEVKTNIMIQATPEEITQRFSDFVKLLHDLGLDAIAQRLVDELSKCALF